VAVTVATAAFKRDRKPRASLEAQGVSHATLLFGALNHPPYD
jgi:hypothetical protein